MKHPSLFMILLIMTAALAGCGGSDSGSGSGSDSGPVGTPDETPGGMPTEPELVDVPSRYSVDDAARYFVPKDEREPGRLGGPPPLNLPGGPGDPDR